MIRKVLRHPSGLIGSIVIGLFLVGTICAPLWVPYEDVVRINLRAVLRPPSIEHPLGTDQLGRDLLGRLVWGGRVTLGLSLGSVLFGVSIGTLIGLLSGYYDGRLSSLAMRCVDAMLAFPRILVALLIIAVLGQGSFSLSMAIGISTVPIFARLVRGATLGVKHESYIEAARALGCSGGRVVFRHILPNILSPIIVQTTLTTAAVVILASGLSFLGLGPSPPTPEWGSMVADARSFLHRSPHIVLVPSVAVFIVVLGFNLLGDALRDVLDPRTLNR